MAYSRAQLFVPILFVLVVVAEATPQGIAKNPSHATCKIKKYKHCYNLVHVCPKFCPNGCYVECASCKPICNDGGNPNPPFSPPEYPPPSTPTPSTPENPPPPSPSSPENPPPSPSTPPPLSPTPSTPENPPPSTPPTPSPSPPPPSAQENPQPPTSPTPPSPPTPSTSPTPSPSPPTPSTPENPPPSSSTPPPSPKPENPPPSPPTPPPSPPTPSSPKNPPSSPSTPPPSPLTPSSPKNPPPSHSTPPPYPPTPSTPENPPTTTSTPPPSPYSPKTARCRNKYYPQCYNMEHVCPNACPGGCEVDCVTCKPVCHCDRPGAVCQDPRFIGGDGITFYFHGKKDSDFCLVSDPNLHINAHFIGRRNQHMTRDFTWVQSIAILFGNHQLFVGAQKTAIWDDSVDRLSLAFDGQPITLPESGAATWKSATLPGVSIVRAEKNSAIVEIEGMLKITAKIVPITEEDSRIHNYGITKDDCFAHLDLGFKFFSLSNEVSGVLGQTYRPGYASRLDIRAKMPLMGGEKEFETTSLFTPDCSVGRFVGSNGFENEIVTEEGLEPPSLRSTSGFGGRGVVCKR